MPGQTYKNQIQKDTNAFLEATLLQSQVFDDDDDQDQEKRNIRDISLFQAPVTSILLWY